MGGERPPVVLLSSADWKAPYPTNKQHVAAGLAARGHDVLYVETVGIRAPSLNAKDFRRIMARIRRGVSKTTHPRKNLTVLSPLTIPFWQGSPVSRWVNGRMLSWRIRRWLGKRKHPLLWTYHPYLDGLVESLRPRCTVYHCVDNLATVPGVDPEAYGNAERKLLSGADIVFTTSEALKSHCEAIANGPVHFLPNVADRDFFARARLNGPIPAEIARIPHPRLCYSGALTEFKVDFELLEKLARARPDLHLVLIGDEPAGQHSAVLRRLREQPNVHLIGWRPYERLPDYLRGMDIGLLPLLDNAHTQAVFPMKFFEYLAAGLPVVATSLPALDEFDRHCGRTTTFDAFVEAIDAAITEPLRIPLDDPVLTENTWDRRLDRMFALIDDLDKSAG